MYALAHLAFKNYDPPIIEKGMLFINTKQNYVYEATEDLVKGRPKETIVAQLGYPVEVYVVDEEDNIIASPNEIALWHENDESDSYRLISVKDMNILIEEWDGVVEIDVFDMSPLTAIPLMPVMITGKVILRIPVEAEEEFEEEEDE